MPTNELIAHNEWLQNELHAARQRIAELEAAQEENTITLANPDYVLVRRLDLQEVLHHKDDTGFYPATAYNNLRAALEGKK
jgi:hypothetical protein